MLEDRANFTWYTVCFFLNFYVIYLYPFTIIFYRITLLPLLYQASNIYKLTHCITPLYQHFINS